MGRTCQAILAIAVEVKSSTSLSISAPTPPQKMSLKNKFSQRQMMTCEHPSLRAPAMFEKQFLIALYPPRTDLVPLCQTSRELISPALGPLSSLCPAKAASSTQGAQLELSCSKRLSLTPAFLAGSHPLTQSYGHQPSAIPRPPQFPASATVFSTSLESLAFWRISLLEFSKLTPKLTMPPIKIICFPQHPCPQFQQKGT